MNEAIAIRELGEHVAWETCWGQPWPGSGVIEATGINGWGQRYYAIWRDSDGECVNVEHRDLLPRAEVHESKPEEGKL